MRVRVRVRERDECARMCAFRASERTQTFSVGSLGSLNIPPTKHAECARACGLRSAGQERGRGEERGREVRKEEREERREERGERGEKKEDMYTLLCISIV